MSKYCLIFVLALFTFATSVQATDGEQPNITQQYVLDVINSDYNWFNGKDVIDILDSMLLMFDNNANTTFWQGISNSNGGSWGTSTTGWVNGGDGGTNVNPMDATTIAAAKSMLDDARGWLQAGFYSNADGWESVTQTNLYKGHMVHMSGSNTEASALGFDDAGYAGWASQTSTNIFFLGRNVTWPNSPGYVNGEYGQFKIAKKDGASYTFNFSGAETPIVLDMDGDGKLEASAGQWLPHQISAKDTSKLVSFDMDCDGFDDLTEWVGPNDGLLLTYNGGAVTAENLFGNEGGTYKNGYEKLSLLDTNRDGKITGEELNTLSIWQDKNGNAKIDQGEVTSVASLGITEIVANHKNLMSSFIQNGTRKMVWDWYPCVAPVKKHHN